MTSIAFQAKNRSNKWDQLKHEMLVKSRRSHCVHHVHELPLLVRHGCSPAMPHMARALHLLVNWSAQANKVRMGGLARRLIVALLAGGAVFLTSGAGASVVWATTTGGAVNASPAVVNGVAYVGSDDNYTYSLNATTGQILWQTLLGGVVDSSPTVINGLVHVGSGDGRISALNAATGQFIWQTITGAAVNSSPAVVNGVVYIGSDDGYMYSLNAATGQFIWMTLTGGAIDSSPALANDVVYFGSDDNYFYSLVATTGEILWR